MKVALMVLCRLANSRPSSFMAARSSVLSSWRNETLWLSSAAARASFSTLILADEGHLPLFNSIISSTVSPTSQSVLRFNHPRSFSTDSSAGQSNIISIESEVQFDDSLRKAQDESLPAIFYFTASWSEPCRALSPTISELSKDYPHVTTYIIDIDQVALLTPLLKSHVEEVPTLHLFQNGKKASVVVGAVGKKLKSIMENLYIQKAGFELTNPQNLNEAAQVVKCIKRTVDHPCGVADRRMLENRSNNATNLQDLHQPMVIWPLGIFGRRAGMEIGQQRTVFALNFHAKRSISSYSGPIIVATHCTALEADANHKWRPRFANYSLWRTRTLPVLASILRRKLHM